MSNTEVLLNFLKKNNGVSIPEIKNEFNWSNPYISELLRNIEKIQPLERKNESIGGFGKKTYQKRIYIKVIEDLEIDKLKQELIAKDKLIKKLQDEIKELKPHINLITPKPTQIKTKIETTPKQLPFSKNADIRIKPVDQEMLRYMRKRYPEGIKRAEIIKNTNISLNQVKERLNRKFLDHGLIEIVGGNKHNGYLYKLVLEKYNLIFDDITEN